MPLAGSTLEDDMHITVDRGHGFMGYMNGYGFDTLLGVVVVALLVVLVIRLLQKKPLT